MPATLRAHARQNRARHRKEAEDVRVELRADLTLIAPFDRALIAVARIVDEHVDRAELFVRLRHGGLDLRGVGHVQRHAQQAFARIGREVVKRRLVARSGDATPAAFEHSKHQFAAEAGRAAGDEPDGGCVPGCIGHCSSLAEGKREETTKSMVGEHAAWHTPESQVEGESIPAG